MPFDPQRLEHFPMQPGVYLMKNAENKVIYVGKANQLRQRLKQYFSLKGDGRAMVPFLTAQTTHIDTIVVSTEKEALLLENILIKQYKPKFNVLLKDDKTFISLMINDKHPWPTLRLIRYKDKPQEEGVYFGPYTNAYAARQIYDLLLRVFPLRQCSDEELKRRKRPCLLYSIKRCVAPCVQKCSKEHYAGLVKGVIQFLQGKNQEIIPHLYKEMHTASEKLEFEKAAALLQIIRQIEEMIHTEQLIFKNAGKNCDVLALYRQAGEVVIVQLILRHGTLVGSEHYCFSQIAQDDEELLESFLLQNYHSQKDLPHEIILPISLSQADLISGILSEKKNHKTHLHTPQKGEKRTLVELAYKNAEAIFNQEKDHIEIKEKRLLDLQESLSLSRYPKRIECFDTSNISGSDPVACMIAFLDGEKDRKRTRLFHIKHSAPGDDYAALQEVLTRRLKRAKEEEDLPDLLIVDGGKGQLSTALKVLQALEITSVDLISVAKEEGRHDKGMTKEQVFLPYHKDPILLESHSPLLFLLQQIRDESHRVAIAFHRKKRSKRILESPLDKLPGIGPAKKRKLLLHFGSLKRLKETPLPDLEKTLRELKGFSSQDITTIKNFVQA